MKLTTSIIALLSTLLLTVTAHAGLLLDESLLDTDILGGIFLVATDDDVEAAFLGSDAGYFNILYLDSDSPAPKDDDELFNEYSGYGSTISLGNCQAGTELIFRLFVTNTELNFYSGAGLYNPDNLLFCSYWLSA
jgi:hypothetical protein